MAEYPYKDVAPAIVINIEVVPGVVATVLMMQFKLMRYSDVDEFSRLFEQLKKKMEDTKTSITLNWSWRKDDEKKKTPWLQDCTNTYHVDIGDGVTKSKDHTQRIRSAWFYIPEEIAEEFLTLTKKWNTMHDSCYLEHVGRNNLTESLALSLPSDISVSHQNLYVRYTHVSELVDL